MTLGMKIGEEASNKIQCNTIGLEHVPSKHEVMGSSLDKVPHLIKPLARFNKNPFHQRFSHRNGDYKFVMNFNIISD